MTRLTCDSQRLVDAIEEELIKNVSALPKKELHRPQAVRMHGKMKWSITVPTQTFTTIVPTVD